MDHEHHTGKTFKTCWTFLQKNRTATEPMDQFAAPQAREVDLREMSVRWFMDTQAPIILRNGIFPSWFQGFITRKDAEKTLQVKELGSFLIRLSDKGPGYILSYKGNGRCRHFMICQDKTGQFIVSGDTKVHDALTDLIEFYKMNPIQPFGEHLTYSCFEECAEELYDMIQVSHQEKPPANPRARMQPAPGAAQSRHNQEEIPAVPRRRRAQVDGGVSDWGSAPCGEEMSHARLGKPGGGSSSIISSGGGREGSKVPSESAPGRVSWLKPDSSAVSPGRKPHHLPMVPTTTTAAAAAASAAIIATSTADPLHVVYSVLQPLETKSASLPQLLDSPSVEDTTHRRSPPPPIPSPRSSLLAGGTQGQRRGKTPPAGGGGGRGTRPISSHSLDFLSTSPMYYLATDGRVDADEPSAGCGLLDGEASAGDGTQRARAELRRDSHTYESLEDLRSLKPAVPSTGSNNDKRKWFPDLKRK